MVLDLVGGGLDCICCCVVCYFVCFVRFSLVSFTCFVLLTVLFARKLVLYIGGCLYRGFDEFSGLRCAYGWFGTR